MLLNAVTDHAFFRVYDIIPVSGLKVQQAVTGLWRFCVCILRAFFFLQKLPFTKKVLNSENGMDADMFLQMKTQLQMFSSVYSQGTLTNH